MFSTGFTVLSAIAVSFPYLYLLTPFDLVLKLFHERTEPLFRLISVLAQETKIIAQARDFFLPCLINGEVPV